MDGLFVFEVSDANDRRDLVNGGPWNILGALVVFRAWDGRTDMRAMRFDDTLLWVQMVGCPVEDIDQEAAYAYGSTIGDVVETDLSRIIIMRVKVRVDISEPLVSGACVELNGSIQRIQFKYERVYEVCYNCGRVGHNLETCLVSEEEAELKVSNMTDRCQERMNALTGQRDEVYVEESDMPLFSREVRGFRNIDANRTSRIMVVNGGGNGGGVSQVVDDRGRVMYLFCRRSDAFLSSNAADSISIRSGRV